MSQIKTILKLTTSVFLALSFSLKSLADNNQVLDQSMISEELTQMLDNAKSIEKFTERGDLGRLKMLEKTIQKSKDISEKNGLLNAKTMNSFLEMAISFRYSQAFFSAISTNETQDEIKKVQNAAAKITKAMGLDESPATQITANTLTQIKQLTDQLVQMDLSDSLKMSLKSLNPQLGRAIAEAQQGDRPLAFQAADLVIKKYLALYPQFDKVMAGKNAFPVIIEVQGLVEFYLEFAQFSERFGDAK